MNSVKITNRKNLVTADIEVYCDGNFVSRENISSDWFRHRIESALSERFPGISVSYARYIFDREEEGYRFRLQSPEEFDETVAVKIVQKVISTYNKK